jgi:CRISPR-associated protein Cas5h
MVVGFKLRADFGHFSHPATIYSSLTYPVPPKTAVMGMIGAIMGLDDYLFLNRMRYSVTVKNISGKRNFCFNGVKDALSQLTFEKAGQGFGKGRKQFYRELLIDPEYTVFCDFSGVEGDFAERFVMHLKEKKALYPVYMGINLCLADFEYIGVFEAKACSGEAVMIDSMVPLESAFEIEPGKNYTDIRMATTVSEGRIFGGFRDYLVETTGEAIRCKGIDYTELGDEKVIFT